MTDQDRWELDPRCTRLPDFPEGVSGQFVRLENGELLAVRHNTAIVSKDDGESWSERGPIYAGPKPAPGIPNFHYVLVQTVSGTTVMVYMDRDETWGWNDETGKADPDVRLDVWSVRSTDGGQTWRDRQMIMQGYCGALITMIQLSSGEIVVPVQDLLRDPDRHSARSYVSEDDGVSWRHGNIIDLGGHGHHDGAMEPTLAELRDGSVLMLIRTNLDYLWEARSLDKGLYWRVIQPSKMDASSAPASIRRLASGRLCLVWNRLYLKGMDSGPRRSAGPATEVEASWQRTEISIAFSEDEAQSWTEPQVFLSLHERYGFCYPSIFEPSPGLLWINKRFRGVSLREEDFI